MAALDRDMLPPLPKIEGDTDLLLAVYTHSSLRPNGAPMNREFGDTERLADLGCKALNMAVTYHLFSAKPVINAKAIKNRKEAIISDEDINVWLDAYGLKDRLRIDPEHVHLLENLQEMRRYFYTYIGALYIRGGHAPIQTWISGLIDPTVNVVIPGSTSQLQEGPSSFPTQAGVESYENSPHDPSSHYTSQSRAKKSKRKKMRREKPWMAKGREWQREGGSLD